MLIRISYSVIAQKVIETIIEQNSGLSLLRDEPRYNDRSHIHPNMIELIIVDGRKNLFFQLFNVEYARISHADVLEKIENYGKYRPRHSGAG